MDLFIIKQKLFKKLLMNEINFFLKRSNRERPYYNDEQEKKHVK